MHPTLRVPFEKVELLHFRVPEDGLWCVQVDGVQASICVPHYQVLHCRCSHVRIFISCRWRARRSRQLPTTNLRTRPLVGQKILHVSSSSEWLIMMSYCFRSKLVNHRESRVTISTTDKSKPDHVVSLTIDVNRRSRIFGQFDSSVEQR